MQQQQLESGSKSRGCIQRESEAGRGGASAVHDRRGARTTTEPKAPEIIMTPAWQLGQRRNICLVTQHENIFQQFPLSSIPVSLARHVALQLAVLGPLPVHANESWIHVRCAFPGRPLLTQCTMRWPRGAAEQPPSCKLLIDARPPPDGIRDWSCVASACI